MKGKKFEIHGKMSFILRRKKKKKMMTEVFTQKQDMGKKERREETEVKEIWLARDIEEYEEKELLPGEMYHLALASMTSDTQACLRSQTRTFLTKPHPAGNLKVATEEWGSLVTWSPPPPPGHSCLDGYRVEIRKAEDSSTVQPLLVKSLKRSEESVELKISELGLVSDYRISLFSTASRSVSCDRDENMKEKLPNMEILRESSLPVETSFTLSPSAPSNLRLEGASHSSLKVKWDPTEGRNEHIVSTKLVSSFSESKKEFEEIKVNGNSATLSKLDSGQAYLVSVAAVVNIENRCFKSKEVSIEAPTKPMPPTNLKISTEDPVGLKNGQQMKLVWKRSTSMSVTCYELTVRGEDEYEREKYLVEVNDREYKNKPVSFVVPIKMEVDVDYKINVYSLFEHGGVLVRSDPLHARVRNGDRDYLLKSKLQLASKRKTMSMSDLLSKVTIHKRFY